MHLASILPVDGNAIGFDPSVDLLLIIPTVATPQTVCPTVERLVEVAPPRTRILLSINPKEPAHADEVIANVVRLRGLAQSRGVELSYHREDGLRGFGGAINIGTRWQIRMYGGLPKYIGIWNDDLIATPGSIERVLRGFDTESIRFLGDMPDDKGRRPPKPVHPYGRIGQIGPVTNVVGGNQRVDPKGRIEEMGLDGFAAAWGEQFDGHVVAAEFLSGFCMFWSRECFLDLSFYDEDGTYRGIFDADRYPVAGYEDNDLCVRVERSGWRSAIAYDAFLYHVGHQTFDHMFPDWQRGMRNRLAFLDKWRGHTERPKMIAGIQRVRVSTVQDLHLWRASISRSAQLLDGLAVLLTGNPAAMMEHPSWAVLARSIPETDRAMVEACQDATPESCAGIVRGWLLHVAGEARGVPGDFYATVEFWQGQWNERDERNRAMALGEGLIIEGSKVDWLLSIDHDEVIEDRITRRHIDRWMAHPDPLVSCLEVGWLNHWEGSRMVRLDRPWGDGGTYKGGMAGPRMWRVNHTSPRRILHGNAKGLHCGNAPLVAYPSVRVSSFRFRHFGYVDPHQRRRKRNWYDTVDPNPDPLAIGGADYGHITDDEGMQLRPYVAANGIGLFMLAHRGEDVEGIARLLDTLYMLVDRIVLVWTDEWADDDQFWLGVEDFGDVQWDDVETGPSEHLARLSRLYGVEWVHRPLEDNLAAARNAGISALRKYAGEGLGWAMFFDPDEHFSDDYRPLRALRSMAEVSKGWGWMVRFRNMLRSGGSSYSESVRMFRLDPEGIMAMSGRVHEGFDDAFAVLRSRGEHPEIKYAPFACTHLGLAKTDDEIAAKLAKYRRMLRKELGDKPHSPGAWTSLGMQYLNDGEEDAALECFERGVLCAGTSYLPFKEAAYWHLRRAKAYLSEAMRLTVKGHPVRTAMEPIGQALHEMVPTIPMVGSKRLEPQPLPDFPLPSHLIGEPPAEE